MIGITYVFTVTLMSIIGSQLLINIRMEGSRSVRILLRAEGISILIFQAQRVRISGHCAEYREEDEEDGLEMTDMQFRSVHSSSWT